MFEIGWSELLLIGIVALIAIGPKELPGVLRTVGQWTAKLRRMAADFQNQFHEAMREAELADLKKEVDNLTSEAKSYTNFDPVADVRRELESTQRQIETSMAEEPKAETKAQPQPQPEPHSSSVTAPVSSEPEPARIQAAETGDGARSHEAGDKPA